MTTTATATATPEDGTDGKPRPRALAVVLPSLGAGALTALSVPPWGFWPLAFAGIAVLAWRLRGLGMGARLAAGLAYGWGLYGITIFWVTEFHLFGWLGLVTLLATFFGVAGALTTPGRSLPVALPAALVLTEAVRDIWPVGGIPIGGIALGQVGGPLLPIARLGGSLLVIAAVAVTGVGLTLAFDRRWRAASTSLAAVAVLAATGAVSPSGRVAGVLDVALVQGGGPRGFRAMETDPATVFDRHVAVSEEIPAGVDLVVWPENAIDVVAITRSPEEEVLGGIARAVDATVVAGVTEDVGPHRFHNVAVAWAPDGEIVDRYVKVKRVPFGEYAPYRHVFGRVADLSILARDAVAGVGPGMLETPAGRLGVAVSYEVFFRERGLAAARSGGEVLLVPTNAASFKTSQVPTQEVAAAQLRAVETGRWVLQSAPTGYTAVVDPRGVVVERSVLGDPGLVVAEVERRTGGTPFTTTGDGAVLAVAVLALVGAWALGGPAGPQASWLVAPLQRRSGSRST